MASTNESYIKYVLNDLKNHKGLFHPKKALWFERIKARQVAPQKLHPNPEDEFSMESIGPNWNIVGDYEKSLRWRLKKGLELFDDPLIAVKLDKGGYMLLNGHHRWMASLNLRLKKVPVQIVNITSDDDVYKVIEKSKRNRCVTIDFEEVLFEQEKVNGADNRIPYPFNYLYKRNIRENASLLIREMQRLGFDVWVYSGSYYSEQYIKWLFRINKCSVDGVVNGLDGKRTSQKLKTVFREKYDLIAHVDNESITFVNPHSKKYDIKDIGGTKDEWSSAATELVRNFDESSIGE